MKTCTNKFIIFLGENRKQFKNIWAKRVTNEKRKIVFGRKKPRSTFKPVVPFLELNSAMLFLLTDTNYTLKLYVLGNVLFYVKSYISIN